jgi:uncharacterized protein YidB (DUF937 family)
MDDLTKQASEQGGAIATEAGLDPAALAGLQGAIQQEGGIDGLMAKLKAGGLGSHVDSWVGSGENQPVEPALLQQALGPDTVQRLSSDSGLDIGKLLPLLAMFLPQIVNMLTPDGKVPDGGLNGAAASTDLTGMLGGLLGGAGGSGGAGGLGDILGGLTGMLGGNKN